MPHASLHPPGLSAVKSQALSPEGRVLLAAALALGLLGCGQSANAPGPAASASRCATSPSLPGPLTVADQRELDALAGCETIDGDLSIAPFDGADLRPLGSL